MKEISRVSIEPRLFSHGDGDGSDEASYHPFPFQLSHDFSVMEIHRQASTTCLFIVMFQLSHDFSVMEIRPNDDLKDQIVSAFQLSHDFSVMEML